MYLFDTDVLSHVMKPAPPAELQEKFYAVLVRRQFTSSINLGELVFGAIRKGSRKLMEQIEELVVANLSVLPFDAEAARRYGQTRAELERRGMSPGDADLRIAAIALSRGLIVVTGNTKHFERVPELSVENWLRPE